MESESVRTGRGEGKGNLRPWCRGASRLDVDATPHTAPVRDKPWPIDASAVFFVHCGAPRHKHAFASPVMPSGLQASKVREDFRLPGDLLLRCAVSAIARRSHVDLAGFKICWYENVAQSISKLI